jgi:methionine-R-sulfoxide reductase
MMNWKNVLDFADNGNPLPAQKIEKSETEWKALLSPEVFHITRLKGTERPHSSELCNLFSSGIYSCACCQTELFDSSEKFESGTGWPSFTEPVQSNAIAYSADNSHGMRRVEALCNTCGAHLGHVFPDGPAPSGLRFCINALALIKSS